MYGIDVEVENMLYARPILPPTRYGSTLTNVDDSQAKRPDNAMFDQPRSASISLFNAAFDEYDKFLGMEHALAAG